MSKGLPTATHIGELKIGDIELPCAVLPGGIRVITQGAISAAFGPVTGGYQARQRDSKHTGELPLFLVAKSLEPFISKELRTLVSKPYKYKDPRGGPTRIGFEATIAPKLCDVWLEAQENGALTKIQEPVAKRAELLMRGLAHVGIIGLVDEATGYQEIRDRKALHQILDKFLLAEQAKWAKRFPDDFYKHIFRLRGWEWRGMKVNRPSVVGRYTNDIIWDRLAPGIRRELEQRNPRNEFGRRPVKHHQWLTDDIGHPALQAHLNGVLALLRGSSTWESFKRLLARAFPKYGDQMDMFEDD